MSALQRIADALPPDPPTVREGWPPFELWQRRRRLRRAARVVGRSLRQAGWRPWP